MNATQINEAITSITGAPLDYSGCLNAMHEAEKVLTRDHWSRYYDMIEYMTGDSGLPYQMELHATAAQRAEAFLRTIGKWTA